MRFFAFLGLLLALNPSYTEAQVTIEAGAHFICTGNPRIAIVDTDLNSSGNIQPGQSTINFEGESGDDEINTSGNQLYRLRIEKANRRLKLINDLTLANGLLFSAGLLDLNGFDLGISGDVSGETETRRIVGALGGEAFTQENLDEPDEEEPATLGFTISSQVNLGSIQLARGHVPPTLPDGNMAINRYYRFSGSTNDPNALLLLRYFNIEAIGFDESELGVWHRASPTSPWQIIPHSDHNTTGNFFELDNVSPIGEWTFGTTDSPLPLELLSFKGELAGLDNYLEWETVNELGTSHFVLERSIDEGRNWAAIGQVAAAGYATDQRKYNYTETRPPALTAYRLRLVDLDSSFSYSPIIQLSRTNDLSIQLYPNPASDWLKIQTSAGRRASKQAEIINMLGQPVWKGQWSFDEPIDIRQLPAGRYYLRIQIGQETQELAFSKM
ncbi:MAG: T9SS type A sorting domain-containing protein [Bacteroidota bacterium]